MIIKLIFAKLIQKLGNYSECTHFKFVDYMFIPFPNKENAFYCTFILLPDEWAENEGRYKLCKRAIPSEKRPF